MGPGSYRLPNRKAPAGQGSLPKPIGTTLTSTPSLTGVGAGEKPNNKDPRDNGEADFYENFSNIVPQTAETREFAMDMVAAPEWDR